MTIYPESYFLPHKIDENKFDIKDNTYTIHYGTGLWWFIIMYLYTVRIDTVEIETYLYVEQLFNCASRQ